MKRMLLIIPILLLTCLIGYCEEINLDNETKRICNQVVTNIYNDILEIKDKYKELEAFDNSVLGKGGKYNLNSIFYSHNIKELSKGKTEFGDNAFRFSLSIISDEAWQIGIGNGRSFYSLSYPNLGIKLWVSSIQPEPIQLDLTKEISTIVNKNAQLLKKLNQKCSPLQLTIKSDKDVYGVGESIIVQIELKNNSSEAIATGWYDLTQIDSKDQITHNMPKPTRGRGGERFSKLVLESGEFIVEKIDITSGFNKNPGIYKYTAFVQVEGTEERERKGSLTSNTIIIEVVGKDK